MKIPSMTFWTNLVCALAVLGGQLATDPLLIGVLPPRVGHMITDVAMAAMWYRSHRNIFLNPDGTRAFALYPDLRKRGEKA